MQSLIQSSRSYQADGGVSSSKQIAEFPGRFRWHVGIGSTIFEPGEQRRLFRVESGAVCHYSRTVDGQHEVIEFAFPGDVIGLGHLPTHVSTAKAMVETEVCVLTDADLNRALTNDNHLFFKLAEATDREFDYLKRRSLSPDRLTPMQRLANFLLAIASVSVGEGREPVVVADDVSSGYVAEQLQMSIDTVATVLLSLQRSGIVEVSDSRLRILDIAALEARASAA
jgi:CRP/FNR family transcriptional regulator, anaerobic regulatory protein